MSDSRPAVPEIDVTSLAEAVRDGATVVDVREPQEYAEAHVPGAVLIPMGQVPTRLDEIPQDERVYLVCRSGNRSAAVCQALVARGYDAVNVAGGTLAWVRAGHPYDQGMWMTDQQPDDRPTRVGPFALRILETPSLGDRSYLVHDGSLAAVIDPQRDIDRVLDLAEHEGVRVAAVLETHLHNDYLTGGLALAKRTGAVYHVNAEDEVGFSRQAVRDGDVIAVGDRLRLTAVATPGHTYTHLSFVLTDASGTGTSGDHGEGLAVFSGGSLLFGATGRPDLLGDEHTEQLARAQHGSARRLTELLPDDAEVLPTHGFGSFCSATQSEATQSTIGDERRHNPVLTQEEEQYVEELLAGLDDWPAYYVHMSPANAAGPGEPDLTLPSRADSRELRRRMEAGEWVVDLRHRTAFAAGHVRGTYNFGLDGSFSTYLGWLIDWGTPVTLLGDSEQQVAEAQRELVRIGIDRPAAQATGSVVDWSEDAPASFPTATFADLSQVRHHRAVSVLDVRRSSEFAQQHLEGAVNLPIHDLPRRLDEVPEGEVWVHCASGYRAAIAASFLSAAGHHLVAVDDDFGHAQDAGLPMVESGG